MVSQSHSTQKTKGEITGIIKRISGINGVVLGEEQIIFTTICAELYHNKTEVLIPFVYSCQQRGETEREKDKDGNKNGIKCRRLILSHKSHFNYTLHHTI